MGRFLSRSLRPDTPGKVSQRVFSLCRIRSARVAAPVSMNTPQSHTEARHAKIFSYLCYGIPGRQSPISTCKPRQ